MIFGNLLIILKSLKINSKHVSSAGGKHLWQKYRKGYPDILMTLSHIWKWFIFYNCDYRPFKPHKLKANEEYIQYGINEMQTKNIFNMVLNHL